MPFAWTKRVGWRKAIFTVAVAWLVVFPAYVHVAGGISRDGDLFVVDLRAMSDFELDSQRGGDDDIPQRFRKLDGKRVMLTGEMLVVRSAAGHVDQFELVYSISRCCFSGPIKVQHFVESAVVKGKTVDFHRGQVKVIGTLHVGVEKTAGQIQSVYRLDAESAEQA